MNNRVCFHTFDLVHDVPSICGLCNSSSPIFRYEFCEGDENQRAEYMKGFCCASCASKLLTVLEDAERKQWAREQAGLESMPSN